MVKINIENIMKIEKGGFFKLQIDLIDPYIHPRTTTTSAVFRICR